jgi:catechol 2,3-dioxygenase
MTFDLTFTHLGIFVRDVERLAEFYRRTLGFVETDRGHLGESKLIFLSRDPKEHHQLAFVSGLTKPPSQEVINQISFRVGGLPELLKFARFLRLDPPDDFRPINHGNAWSVYFRDPEGNRIEVYTPTPWYIQQPCRVSLDIDLTAEQISASTEEWCRSQPGFMPAEKFHKIVEARILEGLARG